MLITDWHNSRRMLRFGCHGCGERLRQLLWGSGETSQVLAGAREGEMSSSGVRISLFLQWELG